MEPSGLDDHTYAELNEKCIRMARAMKQKGMTGKCIALIAENRFEHYVCMFGAFMAGATYLPLNTSQDVQTTAYMLNFAGAEFLFASERFEGYSRELKGMCEQLSDVIGLDSGMSCSYTYESMLDAGGEGTADEMFYGNFDDGRTAMFCFTSGTTSGKPKCVELTCNNLFIAARYKIHATAEIIPVDRNIMYYSPLPTFHLASFALMVTYVIPCGWTCAISNSPHESLRDVKLFSPRSTTIVPAIAKAFLSMLEAEVEAKGDSEWFKRYKDECDAGKHPLSERRELCKKYLSPVGGELEKVTVVGAMSDIEVVKRLRYFGINYSCEYGLTECSPLVTTDLTEYRCFGSVGRIVPYMEAKLVDGVLYVKGGNVMKGYYKNPEATREILSEDGWLCTGDLAEINEDGFVFIRGRANSIAVLSNGENIDVDELTNRFISLPSIDEMIIIADKKNNNDTLGALVYPASGASREDVERDIFSMNEKLPIQKRIMRFRLVDKPFEKNSMMKIKRYLYVEEEI